MLIIERFEGELAVLETDGKPLSIPRGLLPPEAREGDLLTISIDRDATDARRNQIKKLLGTLFEDSTRA